VIAVKLALPPAPALLWAEILRAFSTAASWLSAREPAGLPRWVWAGLVVLAAYAVGRIGGRVLVGIFRLVLLAAAVLIGWDLVHAAG